MVVVEMVASAKVEAEMAAVEKGGGLEEEMAEATGGVQKVAPVGKAAARPRLSWQLGEISLRFYSRT